MIYFSTRAQNCLINGLENQSVLLGRCLEEPELPPHQLSSLMKSMLWLLKEEGMHFCVVDGFPLCRGNHSS